MSAPLQDKLNTRILGQLLYVMQSSQAQGKQRIAIALSQLTTKEQPSGPQLRLMCLEKKGLDVLLEMVQVGRGGGGRECSGTGRADTWQGSSSSDRPRGRGSTAPAWRPLCEQLLHCPQS